MLNQSSTDGQLARPVSSADVAAALTTDVAAASTTDAAAASTTDVAASAAIRAQERLHHAYLLGLQLMVSTRLGPAVVGDWMFRLFRRQHLQKFLSSFDKLGLSGLPHAVACARVVHGG